MGLPARRPRSGTLAAGRGSVARGFVEPGIELECRFGHGVDQFLALVGRHRVHGVAGFQVEFLGQGAKGRAIYLNSDTRDERRFCSLIRLIGSLQLVHVTMVEGGRDELGRQARACSPSVMPASQTLSHTAAGVAIYRRSNPA